MMLVQQLTCLLSHMSELPCTAQTHLELLVIDIIPHFPSFLPSALRIIRYLVGYFVWIIYRREVQQCEVVEQSFILLRGG